MFRRRQTRWKAMAWLVSATMLTLMYLIGYGFGEKEKSSLQVGPEVEPVKSGIVLSFDAEAYVRGETPQMDDPMAKHAFNVRVSDSVPPEREIPDTRGPSCPREVGVRGSVSVIISFHNEARSALLRTVLSVLKRSPEHLLKEVVLIDDFSNDASDGSSLTSLPKITVRRNPTREGLARSRALGADLASGDYLVFLDSHCEVNTGWLEPLIAHLLQHPRGLASPVIDIIDHQSFKYKASSADLKGGMDWKLNFRWQPLSAEEKSQKNRLSQSFKSPILPGGLFMVKSSWFKKTGGFDRGLEIWGAENIELSLKNWLCGDGVGVVPCSRVGHVFRKRHPYTFPPNGSVATYLHNARRIAALWLDEHQEQFFEALPKARAQSPGEQLESHAKLKRHLGCKPFQWFLDQIYPELRPLSKDTLAFGKLQQGDLCLDARYNEDKNSSSFRLIECKTFPENEKWLFVKSGFLSLNTTCVSADKNNSVYLHKCKSSLNQKWARKRRLLVHQQSGLCLESSTAVKSPVVLSPCRRKTYTQQWDFSVELQVWEDG